MGGKANQERQHHYIAAFQLAGFTVDGSKTGRLFVIDRLLSKEWKDTPIGVAKERDYNAVEAQPDQNVVERMFGKIENAAASVIREIIRNQQIPEGLAFDSFINYVALAATRVPYVRKSIAAATDSLLKEHFRQVFNELGAFEKISLEFAALGFNLDQKGFEELKKHMLGDEVQISLDQTTMVMTTFQSAAELVPHLGQRHWKVAVISNDAPDLICSDRPVSLVPPANIPLRKIPDLRDHDTLLIFPLTKRMVALGTFLGASRISVGEF